MLKITMNNKDKYFIKHNEMTDLQSQVDYCLSHGTTLKIKAEPLTSANERIVTFNPMNISTIEEC